MRRTILAILIVLAAGTAAAAVWIMMNRAGTPSGFTMPPAVPETMEELLADLEGAIHSHHPDLVRSLRPGISIEELAQAEADLGHAIHPDLAALYRWHNGLEDDRELFPGHGFFSLQDAVRLNDDIQEFPYNLLLSSEKNWLVLFPDPAGDGYFYDPSRTYSAGGVFYTFRENNYFRYFPSLKNLLKAVIEMYEEGLLPYELQPEEFDISAQIASEEAILERYGLEVVR